MSAPHNAAGGMMENEVREALREVRRELDEHVEDLNQGSLELASMQDYVGELDLKLEKLIERVDALQALLLAQSTPATRSVRLSVREREVLRVMLSVEEPCTSLEIGHSTGLNPDVVAQVLYILQGKGIPVLAQSVDGSVFYDLDAVFRKGQREKLATVSF